jgi:hypothetical protein
VKFLIYEPSAGYHIPYLLNNWRVKVWTKLNDVIFFFFFFQWPSIWGHLAHEESCIPVQFINFVMVQAIMCCSFSVIQGARVEISTHASNFTYHSQIFTHTKTSISVLISVYEMYQVNSWWNCSVCSQTASITCVSAYRNVCRFVHGRQDQKMTAINGSVVSRCLCPPLLKEKISRLSMLVLSDCFFRALSTS